MTNLEIQGCGDPTCMAKYVSISLSPWVSKRIIYHICVEGAIF